MIAPGYKHWKQQFKFEELTSNHSTVQQKKKKEQKETIP
jgi:hypothetical protein